MRKNLGPILLALMSLFAGLAGQALGADGTWTRDATANWSATNNWAGGTLADGAGSTGWLTPNVTALRTITIDNTNRTLGVVNLGDADNSHAVNLAASGGAKLTFDNGGGNAQLNQVGTSSANTISTPIALADSTDIANASPNLLTISGAITSSVAGVRTLANAGAGSGGVTISGIIGNGAGTVAVAQKSATSLLTLSGVNTFTGGVFIRTGTVNGNTSASAFGAPSSVITIGDTNGSANAFLNGGMATTFANPITVAAGNTGVAAITNTAASTFSGAVTLKSHDLALIPSASALILSGGITGTGSLTLATTGGGAITLSTAAVNPAGAITNAGTGSGLTIISGGVGSNVTAITENSTNSALTISITALTVNGGGTTLANNNPGGAKVLTVSGGVRGVGDAVLKNNSAIDNGITLSTSAITNRGGIVNSGAGSGNTLISAVIGPNVTSVVQNSESSPLTLSGVNTFTGGVFVKAGTIKGTVVNAFGASANLVTIGDTNGSANSTLFATWPSGNTCPNPIAVAPGNSGVATIVNSGNGGLWSGLFTLNDHDLTLNAPAPGANTYIKGGVAGKGNFTLIVDGTSVMTISPLPVNNTGSIINSGVGSAPVVISGGVGSNVTAIIENSTNSALLISTTALTVNSNGTTLANNNADGSALLTVSGGINGSGSLLLKNNSAITNGVILSGAAVNNAGTITNSGTGVDVLISAAIGANVTAITENSASSPLTITGILNVNSNGTTLANNNASGSSLFTMATNVTGLGDLVLKNNSAITSGMQLTGASVNPTGTIINVGAGAGDVLISAVIGASVSRVVQNSASSRLVLAGANIYTGGTTIDSGSLWAANSNGSATGPGPVMINNGAKLQGAGTLSGTVTNNDGGTLAPGLDGTAGGTLTMGNLTWNGGGVFVCEIASIANDEAGAGLDYDQIVVTNSLTAVPGGGNLIIRLDSLGQTLAFETNRNYSLKLITCGTAAALNPADVTLDTSAFLVGGTWVVTNLNKAIYVVCLGSTSTNKNYWVGTGNWSTATNWSMGHAPLPGEDAEFDLRGAANCTADAVSNDLGSLTLSGGYTGTVTFLTKYPGQGSFTNVAIAGDCTVNGGTLTHLANSGITVESDRLALSVAGNLTVGPLGRINVDQKGFDATKGPSPGGGTSTSPGASHGGLGSMGGNLVAPPPTCGAMYYPTNLGSGGYVRGGGAMLLKVSGTAAIDGILSAKGRGGTYAGGAGGSILIQAASVGGTGVVDVAGGMGGTSGVGSGGGGRIAVILSSGTTFGDIAFRAYGGAAGLFAGGAGTIYLQTPGQGAGEGTLIVDNGNLTPYNPGAACTMINAYNLNQLNALIIRNRGILGINTNTTINFGVANIQGAGASVVANWRTAAAAPAGAVIALRGTNLVTFPNPFVISNYCLCLDVPMSVSGNWVVASGGSLSHSGNYDPVPGAEEFRLRLELAGNLTVEAGGAIEAGTKGYYLWKGPSPAALANGQSQKGAGHGGRGGQASTNIPLNCYGSVRAPRTLGSGGGQYTGGYTPRPGAGSIELTVQGTTTVDGVISARSILFAEYRCAGAAAGSIYLQTRHLQGAGSIDAQGDSGNDNCSSGGGGRIAVRLTDSESFGDVSISAAGVAGGVTISGPGTVYLERASQAGGFGTLSIDNANLALTGTNTATQLPSPTYATPGELTPVRLVVTNRAQVELSADLTMKDLFLYTNSILYLKGRTLTLNSAYHEDWGSTNWVVYEGGQIIWRSSSGTLIMIK